jgi:hypothetical protein
MKEFRIIPFLALLVVAFGGGVALAQPQTRATNAPVCTADRCAASHANVPAKIGQLLSKSRLGGYALTLAVQNLLQSEPCAIGDVIYAATNQASPEQALAMEQAVVQALAQLKNADPVGARTLQAYLDCDSANAVVAQIVAAELAQGSTPGGNQNDNGRGGFSDGIGGGNSQGGGGFAGGGGNGNCSIHGSGNGNGNGGGCVSRH